MICNEAESGKRGRGSIAAIDDAPPGMAELVRYFEEIEVGKLATCWVACMVDAAIEGDFRPGDVARALIVVAERLHRTRVRIQQEQGLPLIQGVDVTMKAEPLGRSTPVATAPVQRPAPIPDTAPGSSAKYQVFTGPPPAAKPRHTRNSDALTTATALPENGWFEWTDAPKTVNPTAITKKWQAATNLRLVVYKTAGGKVIVHRLPGAPVQKQTPEAHRAK